MPDRLFLTKIPPGETGDDEAVDRFQGANQFRQEFPSLQFCRQKLWLSPLQQVDEGDKEEKSGDGDEDDVDDDGSGQGEKEDEAREDEEHAEKINKSKPPVFCRCITQRLEICMMIFTQPQNITCAKEIGQRMKGMG